MGISSLALMFLGSSLRTWVLLVLVAGCLLSRPVTADAPLVRDLEGYQAGRYGHKPTQSFFSAPLIKAPIWQVNHFDPERVDPTCPYFFITGAYSGLGAGPSIYSSKDLSLIWADETHRGALAPSTHEFRGQRVLVVNLEGGCGIYNQQYDIIHRVHFKGHTPRAQKDFHECSMTPEGNVMLIYCDLVDEDLTSIGGPATGSGTRNCYVQELVPETNEVVFDFSVLEHFPVDTTLWPYKGQGVFDMGGGHHDYCHINSVEKTPAGDYLISIRHFSSLVLVGADGMVKWVLGGRKNQFTHDSSNGKSAYFAFQHQARFSGENRITLFDNSAVWNGWCHGDEYRCSRGLELEIDPVAMTVKVVDDWYHPQEIVSCSRGGVQRLPSGGTVVAWGQNPMYTEWSADKELVMDIQRGQVIEHDHGFPDFLAYRIWKGDWKGQPRWGPNISANAVPGSFEKKIYVSWNGATDVATWALLLSDSQSNLDGPERVFSKTPRLGFETAITIPKPAAFARVAALDADGHIIGSTPAVQIESGRLIQLNYPVRRVKYDS